jgi:hypothetical protein
METYRCKILNRKTSNTITSGMHVHVNQYMNPTSSKYWSPLIKHPYSQSKFSLNLKLQKKYLSCKNFLLTKNLHTNNSAMLYRSRIKKLALFCTCPLLSIYMGIIRKAHQAEILPKSTSLSSPYSTTNP